MNISRKHRDISEKIKRMSLVPVFCFSALMLIQCAGPSPTVDVKPGPTQQENESYNSEAVQFFMSAETYAMQGDHAMAVLDYQDALQHDSTSATIWAAMGKSYLQLGKTDRGIAALEKAAKLDATDIETLEILGRIALMTKDFKSATGYYLSLIKSNPDESDYYHKLAALYVKERRIDEAIAVYDQLLLRKPGDIDALEKAGEISFLMKKLEKAVGYYDRLIQLDGENQTYRRTRSDLAVMMDDLDGALKQLNALVDLDPQNREIRDVLCELYAYSDDYDTAYAYFKKYIHEFPDEAAGYLNLSFLNLNHEKPELAISTVLSGLEVSPGNIELLFLYGTILNQVGDIDSAIETLEQILEQDETQPQAMHLLANIWESSGNYEKSDSLYTEILNNNPEDIVAMNNFAYSLSTRGAKLDFALELVEKSLASAPDNASYLDTKGWILFQKGEFQEALPYLQKAFELEKDNVELIEHLGEVYYKLGRKKEARKLYKLALTLDEDNEQILQKINR